MSDELKDAFKTLEKAAKKEGPEAQACVVILKTFIVALAKLAEK